MLNFINVFDVFKDSDTYVYVTENQLNKYINTKKELLRAPFLYQNYKVYYCINSLLNLLNIDLTPGLNSYL